MSIKKHIDKQRNKDRCGVWPFQLPKWFPFTDIWKQHDDAYEGLRDRFLKQNGYQAYSEQDLILRMETQKYPYLIDATDTVFFTRMLRRATGRKFYLKPMAYMFKALVDQFGWYVWKTNTIKQWKKEYVS